MFNNKSIIYKKKKLKCSKNVVKLIRKKEKKNALLV